MFIGHFIGQLSELVAAYSCNKITHNRVFCGAIAVGIHEFAVEPIVDSLIINSLQKAEWSNLTDAQSIIASVCTHFSSLNGNKFIANVLGSITFSYLAEHNLGDSTLIKGISSCIGSIIGGEFYTNYIQNNEVTNNIVDPSLLPLHSVSITSDNNLLAMATIENITMEDGFCLDFPF